MKIAIAGSTGFLGQELVKQALSHPKITSIIAISRRETKAPPQQELIPNSDVSKLKSVTVKDFGSDWGKDESIQKDLQDLDGAIWTIAITPTKAKSLPWTEVIKVCHEYAVNGQQILTNVPRSSTTKPLRFVFLSGVSAERDPTKKPWLWGNYCVMRGETETQILSYAAENSKNVTALIAKPGIITNSPKDPIVKKFGAALLSAVGVVPSVELRVIAKVLLEQVTNEGAIKKDTLMNDELRVLGGQV